VVLDFDSGRIRALVGGRDMPLEGFNRATQARRQAGSAFKPFVYGAALDLGQTQLDVLMDAPLALDAGNGRLWEPENASGGFWGLVAMRWAFAFSLNTAAVRLVMEHGTAPVIDRARRAGIASPLRRDLTMALGTSELHPVELAGGVAGIVRGGVATTPTVIDALRDVDGVEVAKAGEPVRLEGVDVTLPGGEGERFLEASSAWEVVDMMRATVEVGTGRAAAAPGELRGGKTGTSSNYKDAWFVGFARGHVVAVWLGQDDGAPLGHRESGDRAALPAWRAIVAALPTGGPAPQRPPGVLPVRFGDDWVDIAADAVPPRRLGFTIPDLPEPLPAAPEAFACDGG
jgi:penicillin-binding protein 1A